MVYERWHLVALAWIKISKLLRRDLGEWQNSSHPHPHSGNSPLRDSSGLRILFLVKIPTLSGGSIRASGPSSQGSVPSIPQKNSKEKLSTLPRLNNGAGQSIVDSGFENVDRTHLVLTSGKPVLQKIPNPCVNVQLKPLGWHDYLTIIQIT